VRDLLPQIVTGDISSKILVQLYVELSQAVLSKLKIVAHLIPTIYPFPTLAKSQLIKTFAVGTLIDRVSHVKLLTKF
jgi:hypothetical protein